MDLLDRINLKKNMPKLAFTILAGGAAVCAANEALRIREVKQLRAKASRLAQENLNLIELACDEVMVKRGWENRILPIDSIDVHKIRMCRSANDAERALYTALVHCLSRDAEGECTLESIHESISGWYDVDNDTPISSQVENAEMTVDMICGYLGKGRNAFLSDFSRQTLVKGAVLLENDVTWAVNSLRPDGICTGRGGK